MHLESYRTKPQICEKMQQILLIQTCTLLITILQQRHGNASCQHFVGVFMLRGNLYKPTSFWNNSIWDVIFNPTKRASEYKVICANSN